MARLQQEFQSAYTKTDSIALLLNLAEFQYDQDFSNANYTHKNASIGQPGNFRTN
ncbi:hypothetical protein [Aquimarina aggregata]|uniref:hypothetical protein n=1 Tax=Aquimarina aggregata TaxID=1642818 RepID=UPI000A9B8F2D|nr:hypothetical protein [Aquimarina aggregata]